MDRTLLAVVIRDLTSYKITQEEAKLLRYIAFDHLVIVFDFIVCLLSLIETHSGLGAERDNTKNG